MDDAIRNLSDNMDAKSVKDNSLLRYVQGMDPEMITQLSRPASSEVMQVMEHNVVGLLGGLPSAHFDVSVTTNRENLGRLLASAMMSGYFLRGAEQRLAIEEQFSASISSSLDSAKQSEENNA